MVCIVIIILKYFCLFFIQEVKCSNAGNGISKPSCKECPVNFCESADCEWNDIDKECVAIDTRVDSKLSDVLRSMDLSHVDVLGGNFKCTLEV